MLQKHPHCIYFLVSSDSGTMAFTLEGLQRFGKSVLLADSFPLFVAYLLMIFLAGLWQKFTKPLSLRPVSSVWVYSFFFVFNKFHCFFYIHVHD